MSQPHQIPDLLFTGRSAPIIVGSLGRPLAGGIQARADRAPAVPGGLEESREFQMLRTMCDVWVRIYPDATEAEFDAMLDRFARELGI